MANVQYCRYKNSPLRSEIINTQRGSLLIVKLANRAVCLTIAEDIVTKSKANSGWIAKGFLMLCSSVGNIDKLQRFYL